MRAAIWTRTARSKSSPPLSQSPGRASRPRGSAPAIRRGVWLTLLTSALALHAAERPERIPWPEQAGGARLASQTSVRPIRLQSETFAGAGDPRTHLAAAAARHPDAERMHMLVQLAGPASTEDRDRLEQAGIRLLDYLPEQAWFASVARRADVSAATAAGLRWLGPIYAEDRLSPTLAAGTPGRWARSPDGQLRLRVRPHKEVDWPALRTRLADTGASVVSESPSAGELEVRLPEDGLAALADLDCLRWIEEVSPPIAPHNDGLRTNLTAPGLELPPYGLTGAGVVVGMWDAGWPDLGHPDLAGRVIPGEASVPELAHFHATHVAGTLGGAGTASEAHGGTAQQWRGVAPGVTLVAHDVGTGPLIEEHRAAYERHGAILSQNSWGITVSEFFGNCHLLGNYSGDAPNYDRLTTGLFGIPYHVVFSAGNARGRSETSGCPSASYGTIGVPATAKNTLTVGAINSDDNSMTVFSGWGPTDDGRLKPEFVAPGDETHGDGGINSTLPGGGYGTLVGTSMAAPAVSGVAALLIEDYRRLYHGQTPLPSTLKALLAHTAQDLDDDTEWFHPGPDYASGYGRVQARAAVDQLRAGGVLIGQVGQDGSLHQALEVPPGTTEVKLTLAWDDVPAQENAARTLVNDLDLVVIDPLGNRHWPWTLDPAQPAAPARRDQADRLNVIEQVCVTGELPPGEWTVTVTGVNVPAGTQKFSLVFPPAGLVAPPLVVVESATFRDAGGGNGDGHPDPGEEIEETIVLRNTDGPGGTNVLSWLSSDSPSVRVLVGESPYPALPPGSAGTNLVTFRYRLSKEASCGETLVLRQITAVDEARFTNEFTRIVGRLELTNLAAQVFPATGVPLPLPDLARTAAPLPVAVPGSILDVKAALRLDHTWVDDLRIELQAPDGTTTTLMPPLVHFGEGVGRGACGPEVEWTRFDDEAPLPASMGTAPFVGSWKPFTPLATLAGHPLDGDWNLVITDTSEEDSGTLLCWEIEVEYAQSGYVCSPFNRPPVATDLQLSTWYGHPAALDLPARDPDDDPLQFVVVTPPAHGRLEDFNAATGSLLYLPDPGFHGTDTIGFTVDDGYGGQAAATATVDVQPPSVDLGLAAYVLPAPPRHDQPFQIALTVTNRGPNTATAVLLTNLLAEGITLLEMVASQGTPDLNGAEIVNDFGPVEPGAAATLTLTVQAPVPGVYTNTATAASGEVELAPEDNLQTLGFELLATADLGITLGVAADPTPLARPVTFQIGVTNAGPYAAHDVLLSVPLPPATTLVGATTDRGEWTHAEDASTAALGTLAPGESAALELVLAPALPGPLAVEASVAAGEPDPATADNVATATTTVRPVTDLVVSWQVPPVPMGLGRAFTNVVLVTNAGPAGATDTTLHITPAPGLELLTSHPSTGTVTPGEGVITWVPGALAPAEQAALELVVTAAASGWFTNHAAVTLFEFDSAPADNLAESATEVRPEADLVAGIEPPAGRLVPGRPDVFALVVTNHGPAPATLVTLRHPVPGSLRLGDIAASQGTAAVTGATLTADLGSLEPGASARVDIAFEPVDVGPFEIETAAGAFEVDPAPADNSTRLPLLVELPADLGLTVTSLSGTVPFSRETTFVIVATNAGPSTAPGVRVGALLPEGLDLRLAETSQGTVEPAAPQVVFEFGELPAGSTATGWVHAAATRLGPLELEAWVTAAPPDLEPANDGAATVIEGVPAVDLVASLTPPADRLILDSELTLTLAVTNRGPQTATHVHLVLPLPAELEILDVSPAEGVTLPAGDGLLRISYDELLPDAGAAVTVRLRAGAPGAFNLPLVASAVEADLDSASNFTSWTALVELEADLALACSAAPADLLVGQPAVFTLGVTNQGRFPATHIVLRGTLGSGATAVHLTSSLGTATVAGNDWEVLIDELAPGTDAAVTLEALTTASGSVTNLASVSASQPDPRPEDNACTTALAVSPTIQLAAGLDAAPLPAAIGEPLLLTLVLTNRGPDPASAVRAVLLVPPAHEDLSATASQGSWTFEPPQLIWDAGDLPAGGQAGISVALTPREAGVFTHTASVTAAEADPDPSDNDAVLLAEVRPGADLILSFDPPPGQVIQGQPATYVLQLHNAGPAGATAVHLQHPVPASTTYEAAEAGTGVITVDSGLIEWRLDDLPAGASERLRITVVPDRAGTLPLGAGATAFETDLQPQNNRLEVALDVLDLADLGLTVTGVPVELYEGATTLLHLAVTNRGPHAATGVILTYHRPGGLALQDFELTQGTAVELEDGQRFELGTIEPAAAAGVALHLQALEVGDHTNHVEVSATPVDPAPDDNLALFTVAVVPSADLQITQFRPPPPVYLDAPLQYDISVSNAGPNIAPGVRVMGLLPPGAALIDIAFADGAYSLEGSGLVYEPGDIGPGEQVTLTLVLRPTLVGPMTNTVWVEMDAPDPFPGNNHSSSVADVLRAADLDLTLSAPAGPVGVGQPVDTSLRITNHGPHAATAVVLRQDLPDIADVVTVTASQGTWEHLGDALIVTLGDLPPEGSADVQVQLQARAPGMLALNASVSADEADLRPDDNRAEAALEAQAGADLDVRLEADRFDVIAGREISGWLTVTNHGPDAAVGAVVRGTVPPGTQLLSLEGTPGTWTTTDTGFTGDLGLVPAGTLITATFVARPSEPGTFSSLADASSLTYDPAIANNRAVLEAGVYTEATLSIQHLDAPDRVLPGQPFSLTVLVTNIGAVIAPRTGVLVAFSTDADLLDAVIEGGTLTLAPPGVVCGLGEFTPGESAVITIRLQGTHPGTLVSQAAILSPAVDTAAPGHLHRIEIEVAETPELLATQQGNRLFLSWPAVAAEFDIEATDSPALGNWQPLQNPKVIVGDTVTVNVKLSSEMRFFRLRKSGP